MANWNRYSHVTYAVLSPTPRPHPPPQCSPLEPAPAGRGKTRESLTWKCQPAAIPLTAIGIVTDTCSYSGTKGLWGTGEGDSSGLPQGLGLWNWAQPGREQGRLGAFYMAFETGGNQCCLPETLTPHLVEKLPKDRTLGGGGDGARSRRLQPA